MKKLVVLMLAMLVAGSAMAAPIDPDPNMIGFYADAEATIVETGPFAAPTPIYVVLTNPTYAEILGIEFGFDVLGATMFVLETAWPIAESTPIGGFSGARGDWATGFAYPVPTTEATVVCTMTVLPYGAVDLVLGANAIPSDPSQPDLPTLLDENGAVQTLGLSAGVGNVCLAIGTGTGVVATEKVSLDQVKSLYR